MALKIYNKELNDELVSFIVNSVREKKELKALDEKLIIDYAIKFLEQNTKLLSLLSETKAEKIDKLSKNALFKGLIKHIREKAHKLYGMYQTKYIDKRKGLLEELATALKTKQNTDEIINDTLYTHVSSKERIDDYDFLYERVSAEILERLKNERMNIIDIASGLNPFSVVKLMKKLPENAKINYIAIELNKDDCDYLNEFFEVLQKNNPNFNGRAVNLDLRTDYEKIRKIISENSDNDSLNVCFMFKIVELLEEYRKHFVFKILDQIRANLYFISLPTYTLRKIKMSKTRRDWLEKVLVKFGLNFEFFETSNEIFYVCEKN